MSFELFDTIIKATADSGNIQGLQYGIIADIDDPLKLQRIQVYDQAKGGKFKSGWLMRGLPFTNFSPPVPKIGDLAIFGYIMGDPHHGCYLGVVVNKSNKPVGDDRDFTIHLGSAKVSIHASTGDVTVETEGNVKLKGKEILLEGDKVTFNSPDINLGNPGSAKLAGKSLVVEGAKDTDNDTIIDKGW